MIGGHGKFADTLYEERMAHSPVRVVANPGK